MADRRRSPAIRSLNRVPATGVSGLPGRAIRGAGEGQGSRSGCRGVLEVFLLAAGLVLAAPICGAALLSAGA